VLAIGADLYTPTEYLYGQDDRATTHLDLEERIFSRDEKLLNAKGVVMIQCVGCRNEERNYCSRICCSQSVKNALKLKELNPQVEVTILFRDMRTYGFKRTLTGEASRMTSSSFVTSLKTRLRWKRVSRMRADPCSR